MRSSVSATHPDISIPDSVALARDSDNKVFGFANDRSYHVVQNREVLEFFRAYCDAGSMTLETAGSLKGGEIVWALASTGQSRDVATDAKDCLSGYVLLSNSHKPGRSFQARTTNVRVVCWNTLSAAESGRADFTMSHRLKFDSRMQSAAKDALGLANEELERYATSARKLASVSMNPATMTDYVVRVAQPDLYELLSRDAVMDAARAETFGAVLAATEERLGQGKGFSRRTKGILDAIVNGPGAELPTAKGTAWGAFNGVTRWADHEAGRNRDTGLTSAWFGENRKVKEQALETALAYADGTLQPMAFRG
jgi:hypothetical protein